MMINVPKIGPSDFRPYLAEITECHCAEHCVPRAMLISKWDGTFVKSGEGREIHHLLAVKLLAVLKSGTHRRVTMAEFIQVAKDKAIADGTHGQRGYTKCVL